MQQAYCMANRKETIIDLGNTKEAVGNSFIKSSVKVNIEASHWSSLIPGGSIAHTAINEKKRKDRIEELSKDLVRGNIQNSGSDLFSLLNKIDFIEESKANELSSTLNNYLPGNTFSGQISEGNIGKLKELINEKAKNRFQKSADIAQQISGVDIEVSQKPSVIIAVTRFLLMLTIVISVTMIILNGIQYIIKSGNGEDPSKSRENLMYVIVGIILALFSVVIVNLLRSVGESTLKEISLSSPTDKTSFLS